MNSNMITSVFAIIGIAVALALCAHQQKQLIIMKEEVSRSCSWPSLRCYLSFFMFSRFLFFAVE